MKKLTRFLGMDVHAETIAVLVGEGRCEVRSVGIIPNRPEAVRREPEASQVTKAK
jgi:transposase